MGKVICKEHGEQSFYEICEHAYSDFNNGIKSQTLYVEILDLKLCQNCYETHSFNEIDKLKIEQVLNLKTSESEKIEKTLTEKYNLINRKGICVQCYLELNK